MKQLLLSGIKMEKRSEFKKLFLLLAAVMSAVFFSSGCSLSQASKKNSLNSNLHYQLGLGLYRSGNYIRAMQEFITAKRFDPEAARNYNAIAMVYMMTGRDAMAVPNLEKAVSLDSGFSDAYYNLGIIYMRNKKYPEAEKYFKSALKNPFYNTPYESYAQLAKAYIAEKKYAEALKVLKISKLLNGGYALTYYYLGRYYSAVGNLDSALKNYQKALDIDKFFTAANYREGVLFFRQKKFGKAKEVFSSVYENNKGNLYGKKSLGYIKKIIILNSGG